MTWLFVMSVLFDIELFLAGFKPAQVGIARLKLEIELLPRRFAFVVLELDLHVDSVIADGQLAADLTSECYRRDHLANENSLFAFGV